MEMSCQVHLLAREKGNLMSSSCLVPAADFSSACPTSSVAFCMMLLFWGRIENSSVEYVQSPGEPGSFAARRGRHMADFP